MLVIRGRSVYVTATSYLKDKGKRIKDKLWRDKDVLKDEGKRMKDS